MSFRKDEFDEQFKSTQKTVLRLGLLSFGLCAAALGFLGWVVVVLLKHFGVI